MESRKYLQQLIDAISHCHKKGVYHRDLKVDTCYCLSQLMSSLKLYPFPRPSSNIVISFFSICFKSISIACLDSSFCILQNQPENLLLDARDNLKVSDFGLSALPQQVSTIKCLFLKHGVFYCFRYPGAQHNSYEMCIPGS